MVGRLMFLHPQELSQIRAQIFKTPKPNLLNFLLRNLILKTPEKVIPIYNVMLLSPSSHHDHFTLIFSLKACALLSSTLGQKGCELHARAIKCGHHSDLFVQNSLIEFYSAGCDVSGFRRVFSEILSPDVVSWTSLISAFARNGCPDEALLAFASMDAWPNEATLVSALHACSRLKDAKFGKFLHSFSLTRFGGNVANIVLDNALLDMYVSCGALADAVKVFDHLPLRDVVSWTTLIWGYTQHERQEEAVGLFTSMVRDGGIMPNDVTAATVVRACASMGSLRMGKVIHSFSLRNGTALYSTVGNSFINMYSKCGCIGEALKIFCAIDCKDLVSWCTIIWGMAMNRGFKQAIQLFSLMLCNGIRPDNVAFLAVLSACCHSGMIEEGLMFFKAMYEVYGILPLKEHYTCIIDAYSRAVCLKEAEDFLLCMPMKLDKCVWGTFLSAFKMHGTYEDSYERIRKRVLQADGIIGGGTYALLSNTLAEAERWDESNSVREQMKERRISKLAGYSWIELP